MMMAQMARRPGKELKNMGMSDAQFKALLRVALRDLMDAIKAATPEEKDKIIQSLAKGRETAPT